MLKPYKMLHLLAWQRQFFFGAQIVIFSKNQLQINLHMDLNFGKNDNFKPSKFSANQLRFLSNKIHLFDK